MMKTLELTQVDSRTGYVIERHDMVLDIEKNNNSGERLLMITQGDKAHAMISFKTDADGNVKDFKMQKIID